MLNFYSATKAKLWVDLIFIRLMDAHVNNTIARAKQVAHQMVLCCSTSSLLDQVLVEVNRCNISSCQEATNQRQLKVALFTSSCLV